MNRIKSRCGHVSIARACDTLQRGALDMDAYLQSVDRNVVQLRSLGLVNRTIIMGPIVIRRRHRLDNATGSFELIQAAISTEHGMAAVFWDSEDFELSKQDELFEAEAMERARPLRDCVPAVRGLVSPHICQLLGELLGRCQIL